jgi:hypothetical protein
MNIELPVNGFVTEGDVSILLAQEVSSGRHVSYCILWPATE